MRNVGVKAPIGLGGPGERLQAIKKRLVRVRGLDLLSIILRKTTDRN